MTGDGGPGTEEISPRQPVESADPESFRENRGVSSLQGSGRKVQGAGDYQPILAVRTFQKDQSVTIEIEDNGPGIPDDMKDKILQSFFTTKKDTQGAGLGLSITNDLVKAHGGELSINRMTERLYLKLN